MPPCCPKKSSISLHSKYCENCEHYRGYEGQYRFNQGMFYEGQFFRNSFHGQGTFKWQDIAIYEGGFYSNFKEGYASLSFYDSSHFEGLFIKNQPFGPGILTHSNGRQDAGFWVGRKLVRLSRAVDYIIPRLAPTSAAKIKLLQFRRLIPLDEKNGDSCMDVLNKYGYLLDRFSSPHSSLIYDPRSAFFDRQMFEKTYFINVRELSKEFIGPKNWENGIILGGDANDEEKEVLNTFKEGPIPAHCFSPQDMFDINFKNPDATDICHKESREGEYEIGILAYFTKYGMINELVKKTDEENNLEAPSLNLSFSEEKEDITDKAKRSKIVSWNRSVLCTEMSKQIFRYRAFEDKLHFNLAKLMLGDRTAFRRTGEKEYQCLHFLKMCSLGPPYVIKDLLCTYEISEELMDARGNNSLMFAAVADQHEIIDILLTHGVDVNTFNDEGLTPLNLCLLRRLAQTEGISSWETAFLPKEIDKSLVPEDSSRIELQSIVSLDRIFGDGGSINDSKSFFLDPRFFSTFSSPSLLKETDENFQRIRDSEESTDIFNLSEITILNIPRSPGSYSLFPHISEEEARCPRRNTNSFILRECNEAVRTGGSDEPTPKIDMVPKTNKRDEFVKSIKKSSTDRYLFEFSFKKDPNTEGSKNKSSQEQEVKNNKIKNTKTEVEEEEEEEEEDYEEENEETMKVDERLDSELAEKLAKIDKTIKKLLKRGADPNISEVPKPSIHLGVYTKDYNIVYALLQHGASPDCTLYSNEGLLTPLHVIVLQKPAREYEDICELLLNFGANPEEETTPEFTICEEEKNILDSEHGRTPLQLLCMRPDLEYADPDDHLIKIGLMLAKVSYDKHFYNGHSCLTLAMLSGNMKLFRALLASKYFDPNEILDKNRGTSLHFLVSTELQKRTSYENSIKMCDLLISNKADPLKEVQDLGNCVEYGRREIEEEKQMKKAKAQERKDVKSEKIGKDKIKRDHLEDHEKVVEYLSKIASDIAMGRKNARKRKRGISDKKGYSVRSQDSLPEQLETFQELSIKGGRKTERQVGEAQNEGANRTEYTAGKRKNNLEIRESRKKEKLSDLKEDEIKKKVKSELVKDNVVQQKKENKHPIKKKKINLEDKHKKRAKTEKNTNIKKGGDNAKEKTESKKPKLGSTKKDKVIISKKDLEKGSRKVDSKLHRLSKGSFKRGKYLETCSETFPEKQRQLLLRMFGNCTNIDINEFLVPYVVLRDGELYYRFQGNVTQKSKEQYSLI